MKVILVTLAKSFVISDYSRFFGLKTEIEWAERAVNLLKFHGLRLITGNRRRVSSQKRLGNRDWLQRWYRFRQSGLSF